MKESLPINKDILKWARSTIGLTAEEVASRFSKTEDVILEWESGKSSPTYPQLEKLAYQIYKRPMAVFFFPDIPEEESPQTEFRTLPDLIVENFPSELIKLYRKAKVFQLNLEELFDGNKPVEANLLDRYSLNSINDIPELVSNIREYFDVSIEDQFSWQSVNVAFKQWRKFFEENGIFVFKDAFHNDDYSGFCVYDELYPVIYINNSMPLSRQTFTLFHELGHLLYHLGGIDFRDNSVTNSFERQYKIYEINCNKFANESLVPQKILQAQELIVSEERIVELANLFSVSREVILRNYLDLGLVDANYYRKMADKWIADAKISREESEGGHYYYTHKAYLGDTYINLAFKKYYQEKITIENLSDYLNIKVKNISTFEYYAFG